MTSASPTIFAVETDSAWVVIVVVSLATLAAVLVLGRLLKRPGGMSAGILRILPLVLPIVAAMLYQRGVLPEIAILRPVGQVLRENSTDLLHLIPLRDPETNTISFYMLSGTAGSWLFLIGVSVSSFMLVRRAVGTLLVRRLIGRCRAPDEWEGTGVTGVVERLAARSSLRYTPKVLLLPEGVSGAFAVGARRGRVLVSQDLVDSLDESELEAVLAHEMAHLEARDVQVVFMAGLLRDVVAWNPLAHVAFRGMLVDRELQADKRAASMTGRPLAVASGLLKVCEIVKRSGRRQRLALGFLRPGGRLNRRVTGLLAIEDGRRTLAAPGQLPYIAAACLVAVLGLQVGARVAAERGGFAFTWGTDSVGEAWTPADLRGFRRAADGKPSAIPKATAMVRPERFYGLASGRPVRVEDVRRWYRAMDLWAQQSQQDLIRLRWEARVNWEAVPVFSEPVTGMGIYRFERLQPQPL